MANERLKNDDFIRGFEAGTLEAFPHADHVRMTILYLTRYGRDAALERVVSGILRFATLKGAPEKFHVTVTRAWVELIEAARLAHPEARDAAALVAACPMLLDKNALRRYYSRERLESPEARTEWMPPDVAFDAEAPPSQP